VRLLLDTHIAIWRFADDSRLPAQALELIADPMNEIFVSSGNGMGNCGQATPLPTWRPPNDMPISGARGCAVLW